jgi:hypothetical protein
MFPGLEYNGVPLMLAAHNAMSQTCGACEAGVPCKAGGSCEPSEAGGTSEAGETRVSSEACAAEGPSLGI